MEERRSGKCFDQYYVDYNAVTRNVNSALVQVIDTYEDKIDYLVKVIDKFASAYETEKRYRGSLKRKLDALKEENCNLSKRLKGFTRLSVPRRRRR